MNVVSANGGAPSNAWIGLKISPWSTSGTGRTLAVRTPTNNGLQGSRTTPATKTASKYTAAATRFSVNGTTSIALLSGSTSASTPNVG